MEKNIIFATGNQEKMKEIRMILADIGIPILSMKEAGITADIVENGKTFEENAIIKAKTIMELTGDMALADDSGLEIDYLNGEPNRSLIERLEGVPEEKRTARFVCSIACALPDGRILTSRGTMEGHIGYEIKGSNGFGYDPIFYLPEFGCTSAELSPDQKNEVSHRGKALREMRRKLEELKL